MTQDHDNSLSCCTTCCFHIKIMWCVRQTKQNRSFLRNHRKSWMVGSTGMGFCEWPRAWWEVAFEMSGFGKNLSTGSSKAWQEKTRPPVFWCCGGRRWLLYARTSSPLWSVSPWAPALMVSSWNFRTRSRSEEWVQDSYSKTILGSLKLI